MLDSRCRARTCLSSCYAMKSLIHTHPITIQNSQRVKTTRAYMRRDSIIISCIDDLSRLDFAAPTPTPMPFNPGTSAAPVQTTVQPHYPFTVLTEQFPSILVDGAFAEDIKEYLEKYLPDVRQLKLFVMEISNVT